MKIRINNQQKTPLNKSSLKDLVKCVFKAEGIRKTNIEISLLFVNDRKIQKINKQYLGRVRPTDVISFRMWEGPFSKLHPEILGDVVVNVEMAKRAGGNFKAELALYIAHGLLHLLGYIDDNKKNSMLMQKRCEVILKHWRR